MVAERRVALVGGASRGLGFASAQKLVEDGFEVAMCGRDKDTVNAAAEEAAKGEDARAYGVVADLSDAAGIDHLIRTVRDKSGKIDVLVNNTGGPPVGDFNDITDVQWQKAFDDLFMSTVRLYHGVLPDMRQNKWGRIVNIASMSVLQPMDGLILSNAIRGAVQGLAKTVSVEVAKDGVTVNSVAPAFTATERVQGIARARAEASGVSEEEAWQSLSAGIPSGRIGRPEEVASAVAWLASNESQFTTGSVIPVEGGSNRAFV